MSTTADILEPTAETATIPLPLTTTPGRRARGKIAELSKPLRDELNNLLDNGSTYEKVAAQMNTTHGLDLNTTNIGNWFNSGYQEHLRHQDFVAEIRTVREGSGDVLNPTDILKLHQVANQLSALQIFKTLRDDTLKDDHVNRIRSMNALSRLSREALVFKKYEDALAKEQRAQEQELAIQQVAANPQSKEEIDRQLRDHADDYFGFKSPDRLRAEWLVASKLQSEDGAAASQSSSREHEFAPIETQPQPAPEPPPAPDLNSAICNLPSALENPALQLSPLPAGEGQPALRSAFGEGGGEGFSPSIENRKLAFKNFIHPDLFTCPCCKADLPPLLPNGERPDPFCPKCRGFLRPVPTLHLYCPSCRGDIRCIWHDDDTRTSDQCPLCFDPLPPADLMKKSFKPTTEAAHAE